MNPTGHTGIMNCARKHITSKSYSTLGGKTGKLDEAVNRELNVTKN